MMNTGISIGPRPGANGPAEAQGGAPAAEPRRAEGFFGGGSLTVTEARAGGAEGVGPEVEAALVRDDELGKLFSKAFALPAPPMPDFGAEG